MKVIIMRGAQGSGKSTYQRTHFPLALVCSADHEFEKLDTDPASPTYGQYVYKFDVKFLPDAHAATLRKFVGAIRDPFADDHDLHQVVVDNTNATVAQVAPYAALALAYGHELEIITLIGDPVLHYERNTHSVPLETVQRVTRLIDQESDRFPAWWTHRRIISFNDKVKEI